MSSIASSNSQGSCKLADSDDSDIHPSEPQYHPPEYKIGYGKPPRHAQFRKGTTGCPTGRPMRGNQKAFSKFMKLMHRSGLMRRETSTTPSVVFVPSRTATPEELEDWKKNNFGLPGKRSTK
jgi:hypothetical protein